MFALPVAVLLVVGAALAPSRTAHAQKRFGTVSLASHLNAPNPLGVRLSSVFGSNVPARIYGTEIADMEDQGVNTRGEMVSDLSPLPARSFNRPVATYKSYAQHWIAIATREARRLRRALASGTRERAESVWKVTWSAYLHLGAVYGLFGSLNQEIDGTPGGLPRGTADRHFTGLHRIEMELWTGAPTQSSAPLAARLTNELERLHRILPSVKISPLEYATRAHEILEDAQRDLLSGSDVPWSGEGVLGTAAGLAATREVFHTLHALLQGRDDTEAAVRSELGMLQSQIDRLRNAHGELPTLSRLSIRERDRLDGTLAGALGALAQLPGTLETQAPTPIPKLPGGRVRESSG